MSIKIDYATNRRKVDLKSDWPLRTGIDLLRDMIVKEEEDYAERKQA